MMATPIILFANTAGGTGKTVSAHALAVASAEYGKNALLVDTDPAATLTFLTGIENPRITVGELCAKKSTPDLAVVKSAERFSFIASASRAMANDESWDWLPSFSSNFDLVIVDTASGPSASLRELTSIATHIVIPVLDTFLSIRGALHIRDFLRSAQSASDLSLLPTQCNQLNPALQELITSDFKVLEPAIRFDTSVRDSESSMRSVLSSAPHSDASSDYREVAYSVLELVGIF